jgi:uncharacterized protein YycO
VITGLADIRIGAALFTGGYTPTSWAIRKYLGFKYSHVAMYIGKGNIIEADVGGVQINPMSNYVDNCLYYGEVIVPKLPEMELSHAVVMVMGRLGDKYDYKLATGNVLSRLFHQSRKKLGIYDARNAWMCSELMAYGYSEAGVSLKGLHPNQVTPKDLYRIFKET